MFGMSKLRTQCWKGLGEDVQDIWEKVGNDRELVKSFILPKLYLRDLIDIEMLKKQFSYRSH